MWELSLIALFIVITIIVLLCVVGTYRPRKKQRNFEVDVVKSLRRIEHRQICVLEALHKVLSGGQTDAALLNRIVELTRDLNVATESLKDSVENND